MPSYVNNAVINTNGKIEKHRFTTTIKNKRMFGIILYSANLVRKYAILNFF